MVQLFKQYGRRHLVVSSIGNFELCREDTTRCNITLVAILPQVKKQKKKTTTKKNSQPAAFRPEDRATWGGWSEDSDN